jgi:hypothetical protein
MNKLDLLKGEWKDAYRASVKPALVTVPAISYLVLDGEGNSNGAAFQQAIEALYSVAYTLKFMIKKGETTLPAVDFGVTPLEAQWYMPTMSDFTDENKDKWQWSAMIALPDFVTSKVVTQAIDKAKAKKPLARIADVKLRKMTDGLSAQVMHIGPYSEEKSTILLLHTFIKDSGYKLTGRHREIYLGDPRRSAPDKLRTILRQPCRK